MLDWSAFYRHRLQQLPVANIQCQYPWKFNVRISNIFSLSMDHIIQSSGVRLMCSRWSKLPLTTQIPEIPENCPGGISITISKKNSRWMEPRGSVLGGGESVWQAQILHPAFLTSVPTQNQCCRLRGNPRICGVHQIMVAQEES